MAGSKTPLIPKALRLVWAVVLAVIRVIFAFLVQLTRLAAGAIVGAVELVSDLVGRLPSGVQVALGIAAVAAVIIALVWNKSRKKIAAALGTIWEAVMPIVARLAEWFKKAIGSAVCLAKASRPYAIASLSVVAKFYGNVSSLIDELAKMSAAAA